MQFSTIFSVGTVLLGISIPVAMAAPTVVPAAKIQARQDNGNILCTYNGESGQFYDTWNIYIPNDNIVDSTCGAGFLDNLNGRGCSITEWGCAYDNGGPAATLTFQADTLCGTDDVQNAIAAAAQGKYPPVICNFKAA
ncbi:hypothetical protein ABW20_dc0103981 [Dactylellina cionopaga]|nr:hypothetical protein ABW20_dc0103981 [Dactylellina cionopaga]